MYRSSLIALIFALFLETGCQTHQPLRSSSQLSKDIHYHTIQTTSFFNVPQKITVIEVPVAKEGSQTWGLAYSEDTLGKTSEFAIHNEATLAINGGFFDMKKGGSVTYMEADSRMVSSSFSEEEKWAKPTFIINGALIITTDNQLNIEPNRGGAYYQKSDREKAVLVTGPLLLHKGKRADLDEKKFITARHPRSCVCITGDKNVLLIAIDGRQPDAAGMNLHELQEFLLLKNCRDAINLDGGGSTTLWLKGKGIINSPSDKTGERKVANVLYLRK